MVNFTQHELDAIARIGYLGQECVSEDCFDQIMKTELLVLLNSVSGVLIEFEQRSTSIDLNSGVSYIADHRYMSPYIDYYHNLDPIFIHLFKNTYGAGTYLQRRVLATTSQVIDNQYAYVESEFYQDFLSQTGVHEAMTFGILTDAKPCWLIGLHREKAQSMYSAKDCAMIHLIMPYLNMARCFRQEQRRHVQNGSVMSKLLMNSRMRGYLVLNDAFVLQSYGGRLEELSSDGQAANMAAGVGTNVFRNINGKLKYLLLQMQDCNKKETVFCNLGDNTATVSKQNLRVETIKHDDGSIQYLCLSFSDPNTLLSVSRMLAFGLTPRQIDVVKLVPLGMTNTTIAKTIGISEKTTENYLAAVYRKTGATNKASLISLLSN